MQPILAREDLGHDSVDPRLRIVSYRCSTLEGMCCPLWSLVRVESKLVFAVRCPEIRAKFEK